jgi:hypothetical protein
VSPVRNELGFISQKTEFFIVTTVITSNVTLCYHHTMCFEENFRQNALPSFGIFIISVFRFMYARLCPHGPAIVTKTHTITTYYHGLRNSTEETMH